LAPRPLDTIKDFMRLEAASGIVLLAAAILALVISNTPLSWLYDALLDTPIEIRLGEFALGKPLLLWINDGLMAVFFLLVGLEIKREMLQGELSGKGQAILPAIAAAGGMAVPAALYVAINWGDAAALRGWAIPAATDIAFAVGVLALLGPRVPLALKAFLTAVAIFDDVGAIAIIAVFYTDALSLASLGFAALAAAALAFLNYFGVLKLIPYILIGTFLWVCVLKSGVHATLAGVVLALAIPLRTRERAGYAPLTYLEHKLHPWVAFGIMPLFGFANAGVTLIGMDLATLLGKLPLGIVAGLFVGKQVGIYAFTWVAIRAGLASMPQGVSWAQIYGASLLAGIGFTMSLFIGILAFSDPAQAAGVRIGVLAGSLLSAVCGYVFLRATSPAPRRAGLSV
jgi:Na+:H+ antiporter, NhaA family